MKRSQEIGLKCAVLIYTAGKRAVVSRMKCDSWRMKHGEAY